jgi:hypothetical protein
LIAPHSDDASPSFQGSSFNGHFNGNRGFAGVARLRRARSVPIQRQDLEGASRIEATQVFTSARKYLSSRSICGKVLLSNGEIAIYTILRACI